MQTHLPEQLLQTASGKEADGILRSCVHCGFCTATCPTYLLTGNELDSPRGRIYLIKEMLETGEATATTRTHLERCLSCQSCETTCPSDVQYHSLLNIGMATLDKKVSPSFFASIKRRFLLGIFGSKKLFHLLVSAAGFFRALLPEALARQLPANTQFAVQADSTASFSRHVVLLNGCVQASLRPDTNHAARLVLAKLGIGAVFLHAESCCGALHYHADRQRTGRENARKLIDQIMTEIDNGAEAVISTASGCGNFIKDYTEIFIEDDDYKKKAAMVLGKVKDIGEFLIQEDLNALNFPGNEALAFHSPCTLQHGQQLSGQTEALLQQLGFTIPPIENAHLCCGSAGTYSLFQPGMARSLRTNKMSSLEKTGAQRIATANIGCQCHLSAATEKPVRHWIEYVAEGLKEKE